MNDNIISELEKAAEIIMAPPNVISNEQRRLAESIFLDFRKSKSPYGLCRDILEKSQNPYVLFEAAEVLKVAIIREWSFLFENDKTSLRQYLFQYITTRNLPPFVRDRILQVIAIMVKRASIDDGGRERANILKQVESLIVNAEPAKKILGCNIISNLMQEYATTVKSTDVGLTWEVHFKAKKQFEATDLKRIFQFCIYLLSEVVKNDPPYSDTLLELSRHLLKITESVLTWAYVSSILPKKIVGIYESIYEALKLNESWSEIVLNPDFLPLMFQIYWKVRDIDQLAHHSLICLIQLASLSGGILPNDETRLKYLHSYLVSFFNLISNVTIKNKEALGLSNIVKKLITFFLPCIFQLPDGMKDTLLDEFTRITCHLCDGTAMEEIENEEDRYFTDAFDNMLEAWTGLIQDLSHSHYDDKFQDCAKQVFNKYVQCHLAPPDGCRRSNVDVDDDNEDNDRVRYKDQLQVIGMFGRVVPGHSLQVLYKLLEDRITKFSYHILSMQKGAINLNQHAGLTDLFEDIHWVTLISGHIICMDSDGETPMIPSAIMKYSIDQHKGQQSTLQASMAAIEALQTKFSQPENLEQCDYVIRILFDVMNLCTLEDYAASAKLKHLMSPEVGSTAMWFLKRWCLSYLLPVENYYEELSPTLIGCLGKDTQGARLVVSYVLSKIQSNLFHFQSEPILLRDTVDLFCDIVCVKQKSSHIVRTESMRNLIKLFGSLEPGSLPPNIIRGLCKGFVLAGVALDTRNDSLQNSMNEYYDLILTPLQQRFKAVWGQENFTRIYQEERIQKIVVDLLEAFIGIAKGSLMPSSTALFHFLAPILSELPALITVYHNYQVIVQLVLELFGQCAKYMLCYLTPLDSKRLYESSLATVQAYAKCNQGRFTTETFAEESSFQDLALILDLLTFILSKDCVDLCTETDTEEISVVASDVSLFGLNFIMPLMTRDLLNYPSLCAQYYRLLVLINDIYPEKICNLPPELLNTLLRSIELGLTNFGSDIVQASLDFIQVMATYICTKNLVQKPFAQAIRPFLKLVIDLTLSHQINTDTVCSASTCIYALMCCFQDDYKMLVQSLIQMQSDPTTADRLTAAFNNLVLNVDMSGNRLPKLKFRDNFDKFLANVHGFLLVK
ncbi:exportin-4-like isoform X1 [Diabrotica undecimpunctata]|uniref:exportin-4-like isoform X1 n=2 Tax=Diabrotica undecimpunctata TaxID=50387 RepID=UPI003B63299F